MRVIGGFAIAGLLAVAAGPGAVIGAARAAEPQGPQAIVSTTTTIALEKTSIVYGQDAAITVTITAGGAPVTSGSVTVKGNGGELITRDIFNGVFNYTAAYLEPGAYAIQAVYNGNSSFRTSSSSLVKMTVAKAGTTVTLDPISGVIQSGTDSTFTGSLAVKAPSVANLIAEQVNIKSGDTVVGRGFVNTEGKFTASARVPYGTKTLIAEFPTSDKYIGSTASRPVQVQLAVGTETRLNPIVKFGQTNPAVTVPDYSGTGILAFESEEKAGGDKAIMARRVDGNGIGFGTAIKIASAAPGVGAPAVAPLRDGKTVVVWHGPGVGGRDIFGQVIGADGSKIGSKFRVNDAAAGDQSFPKVASNIFSGFTVVWQGTDGVGSGIQMRMFNGDYTPRTGDVTVNATTAGDQVRPLISSTSSYAYVAWAGEVGKRWGVFVQRMGIGGDRDGAEVRVDTAGTAAQPVVALSASQRADGVAVAWEQTTTSDPKSDKNIFLRRFDRDLVAKTAAVRVNTVTTGAQTDPDVVLLYGGQVAVVWTDLDGSYTGIKLQMYDGAYKPIGTNILANTTRTGTQRLPAVTALNSGDWLAVWASYGQDGSGDGVFGQIFDNPGQ